MAKQPSTGELNQRVTLLKKQVETNEYGGGLDSFAEYWQTWAKAEPLKSSRQLEANQAELRMVVRFTVRARSDKNIKNTDIVLWRGQRLIVQNYIPDPTYKEFQVFDAAMQDAGDIMEGN